MKVYLLNPPFIKNFIRSSRCTWLPIAGSSWPPIFLAYATGLLEKNNHQVKLVDATIGEWDLEKVIRDIEDFKPDITVVYISLDSLASDVKVAEKIKKVVETKIVFVGPWCAIEPQRLLEQYPVIDIIIRREFEWPLSEIAGNKPLAEIGWLNWRDDKGKIVNNADGEFMDTEKLNSLPFVSDVYRRHLDISLYHQSSLEHPFIDLFTARGCAWGQCTFCLWPQTIHLGASYRQRTIDNVIAEIKFINEKIPEIKEIFFQDDMLPPGRTKDLAEAILNHGLKIKWSGYAKTNLSFEILKLAKKSGCRFLHVGYETANQQMLDRVKKGEQIAEMEEFTKNAKKVGIKIHGDFIFGLPGETEETIKKTISWAKKLNISDYQFVVPQPHPATAFYQWLKENNYLTNEGKVNYSGLTPNDLEQWRFYAYRKIYLSPIYLISRLKDSLTDPSEFIRLFKVAIKGLPRLFKFK